MMLDYQSLLLSLGVSSGCLMVTLFGTWYSRRTDSFLLTLVIALCFTVAGIFVYGDYTADAGPISGALAYSLMMIGFSVIYSASVQFRTAAKPWSLTVLLSLVTLAPGVPLIIGGIDGLAFILLNIGSALLLAGTGWQYWLARKEAPGPLTGMAVLYVVSGISFALCAVVLISNQQWVIGHAPDNSAESLNLGVCIAGMTGIGALSLALHQWRLAALHRRDALTDPLTGLMNRRAIFELYGARKLQASTAVIVLDIDYFKAVNDQHGHAAGDLVIQALAGELAGETPHRQSAARLGGEEFAVIVENVLPGRAERIAEDIRKRFSECQLLIGGVILRCTVSAGVAAGTPEGQSFETVLNLADAALYAAKRSGRNRVEVAGYLHPVDDTVRDVPPKSRPVPDAVGVSGG